MRELPRYFDEMKLSNQIRLIAGLVAALVTTGTAALLSMLLYDYINPPEPSEDANHSFMRDFLLGLRLLRNIECNVAKELTIGAYS